jgi:hypothetical protein
MFTFNECLTDNPLSIKILLRKNMGKLIGRLVGLALAACAVALPAKAEELAFSKPHVSLGVGNMISICDVYGGTWTQRCAYSRMPKRAGQILQVIEGDFVPEFPLSWMTMSASGASVCGFVLGSTEIKCMRVKNKPPKGYKIGVYGKAHIFEPVAGWKEKRAQAELTKVSEQFWTSVFESGEKLRQYLLPQKPNEGKDGSNMISTMSECDYYQDINNCNFDSDDGDEQGGSGGSDWGSDSNGSTEEMGAKVTCIGLMCTITITPPATEVPDFPTKPIDISVCGLLGIMCDVQPMEPFIPPLAKTPEQLESEARSECSAECTSTFPTPDYGTKFFVCLRECMARKGYTI